MMRVMRLAGTGILLWAFAACPLNAFGDPGDVFYVNKANTSGVQDGRSWATAHTTIQAGIQAAARDFGGEVWVAAGNYNETRNEGGSLRLRPLVDLYGGFTGAESVRDQRDWNANPTIIDGATSNAGAAAGNVVIGTSDTRLDGFTIRGGRGASGAGLLNIDTSPIVANCIFTDNEATGFGGAVISVDTAAPRFENCRFIGNRAGESGGAAANTAATAEYVDCEFRDNSAVEAGGALFITPGSNAGILDCVFQGNDATNGGAIFSDGSTPNVDGCRFLENVASGFGGAVFNYNGADAIIVNSVFAKNIAEEGRGGAVAGQECGLFLLNCTLADNEAGESGGAVFLNSGQLFIVNSILWEDIPNEFSIVSSDLQVNFSNVEGGMWGESNLDFEPRFRDRENFDFRLLPQSNCINAGTSATAPEEDIDGVARPQGAGIDMGAHEATTIGTPEPIPPLGCTFGTINPGGWPTPPNGGDGTLLGLTGVLMVLAGFVLRRNSLRSAFLR